MYCCLQDVQAQGMKGLYLNITRTVITRILERMVQPFANFLCCVGVESQANDFVWFREALCNCVKGSCHQHDSFARTGTSFEQISFIHAHRCESLLLCEVQPGSLEER